MTLYLVTIFQGKDTTSFTVPELNEHMPTPGVYTTEVNPNFVVTIKEIPDDHEEDPTHL